MRTRAHRIYVVCCNAVEAIYTRLGTKRLKKASSSFPLVKEEALATSGGRLLPPDEFLEKR